MLSYYPGGEHEAITGSPWGEDSGRFERGASTLWAGASLLVELVRRSGVDAVANRILPAKGSAKGLKQGQTVESFVLLSALGGESVEGYPAS